MSRDDDDEAAGLCAPSITRVCMYIYAHLRRHMMMVMMVMTLSPLFFAVRLV